VPTLARGWDRSPAGQSPGAPTPFALREAPNTAPPNTALAGCGHTGGNDWPPRSHGSVILCKVAAAGRHGLYTLIRRGPRAPTRRSCAVADAAPAPRAAMDQSFCAKWRLWALVVNWRWRTSQRPPAASCSSCVISPPTGRYRHITVLLAPAAPQWRRAEALGATNAPRAQSS
jgi:hypothetical protein